MNEGPLTLSKRPKAARPLSTSKGSSLLQTGQSGFHQLLPSVVLSRRFPDLSTLACVSVMFCTGRMSADSFG